MRIGFILSLIFGVFVAIFAVQNASTVSVNFFKANFQVSLALVIFISAIMGALIITLLGLYREIQIKLNLRQQFKKASQLQAENLTLKNEIIELKNNNETKNTPSTTKLSKDTP